MLAAKSVSAWLADPASHFKQLPQGWHLTKVLDQELILVRPSGVATIMSDEFFNLYDKTLW